MHRKLSGRAPLRALALAASSAVLVLAGSGIATAATPTGVTQKVDIELTKGKLKFVGPESVTVGDQLEIVNDTNPKQVGPHTFSLVEESLLPETKPARKKCFTPKHICMAIAHWHGVKGNGPVKQNPAKAGEPGWDTEGNLTTKGDSWFTGEKPKATITQVVSAPGGTEITFMCAIHPWMHGSIEVRPGPTL